MSRLRVAAAAARRGGLVALTACLVFSPAVEAQQVQPPPGELAPRELVLGREANIWSGGTKLTGELLAIDGDSLWIDLGSSGAWSALALSDVSKMQVRMHKWDSGRIVLWNVLAGVGSAFAMTMACSTLDDTTCGGVFVGWTLGWALIGGTTGALVARSSHRAVLPEPSMVRPYTRFPQGMPDRFRGRGPASAGGGGPGG